ncbi:hypothetical protein VSS37_03745 [Candidatus Thiothrix sp. Deng01]|uniref:Uncharacterized protein n=1 Tax=Candidatus Thiothrix phosphatis TaxID=3112415 RepID=A0ABU6CTJ8_9GAMM|nr:hypothetical protein [Candidatus Thiothrix sp. Deng01]MEB4590084.1 hypothetical protein [Candidatus Thiothrix sp. Deng01]
MSGIPQRVIDANSDADKLFEGLALQQEAQELPVDGDEVALPEFDGEPQPDGGHGFADARDGEGGNQEGGDSQQGSAVTVDKPDGKPDGWEHKANVEAGRLRALAAENAQLRRQVEQLQAGMEQQIEQAMSRREAANRAKAEEDGRRSAARSRLTELLDEDTLAAFDQYFAPPQKPEPDKTPKPPDNGDGQARQFAEMRAAAFEADVYDAIEDYDAVINSDGFRSWAGQMDGASGVSRYDLMVQAKANMQAGRLIGMVQRFKAEAQASQSRQQSVQSQVSPGRSRAGATQPATPQYLTVQQIEKHRADFRRGKYRNPEMWDKWGNIERLISLSERHLGVA